MEPKILILDSSLGKLNNQESFTQSNSNIFELLPAVGKSVDISAKSLLMPDSSGAIAH